MEDKDLQSLLERLIDTWENEVIEFKHAGNDFKTDRIGEYYSALSNEANLRSIESAWLVFGIENRSRKITGSDYRADPERLQSTKMQIADDTEPSVTFRNIYDIVTPGGRVILFEIPPAPRGIPIAWKGHYYARSGESLTNLGLDKLDEIRAQTLVTDWTAQIVPGSTIADLDADALTVARESFARKYANRFEAGKVESWELKTFLERIKLIRDGRITRAALLLLGKGSSIHLLSPHPAQITWKLEGPERAYEHFSPPLLLATTELYKRIRNIQIRILPDEKLLPVEAAKYDQKVIMEALHNCIVHQDYARNARILVTEFPDRLQFENEGGFYEGRPDEYVAGEKTPRKYRNPLLAQAMVELNMIDTMGYGIHEMHLKQARRFFPLPDYDISDPDLVRLTIYGKIVDPAYTRMLMQKTDLSLTEILGLDRIQKRLPISEEALRHLRNLGLVEGRKPNIHVSADIARMTASEAEYIKTRAQDDDFYKKLIIDYLVEFGAANREDLDGLLWDKLSDGLDTDQKKNKIGNLLTSLSRAEKIRNTGPRKTPRWELVDQRFSAE